MERDIKFYKDFYEEHRIAVMQYKSLRKHFRKMVDDVLGKNYYNMAMDVYECDRICCEDITSKAIGFRGKLLKDRYGWPIELINGKPFNNFVRIVFQNIRKITG